MIAVLQARLFKLVVDLVQKELWVINLRSKPVPKSGLVDVLSSFANLNASSSTCGWYETRVLRDLSEVSPTWGRMSRPLQGLPIPSASGLFRSAVHIILEISGGSRLPRSRPFRNHLVDVSELGPRIDPEDETAAPPDCQSDTGCRCGSSAVPPTPLALTPEPQPGLAWNRPPQPSHPDRSAGSR